jgi:hypothetical protein
VKALQGPRRFHGEFASSALKKAPVIEVRRITIG